MKASRILFIMAVAALALTGCRKHDRPERQHNNGNGGEVVNPGGDTQKPATIELKENKNWIVEYSGRTVSQGNKVELIDVSNIGQNIIYLVSVIDRDNYRNYGGKLKDFMEAELAWVMEQPKEDLPYYVYSGPQTIQFNPFRHGTWYAFIIALDSNYKLTGEYAYSMFEVEEETPTDDFKKWLGTWRVKGKTDGKPSRDVVYKISVESEEANFMYRVYDWEALEVEDANWVQMNLESIVTFYDGGDMYFTSQYIQTYDDEEYNDVVEEVFLGEVDYNGILHEQGLYIIEQEDIDLAFATISQDGQSAAITPVEVTTFIEDEEFTANFYDMKYFGWSQNEKGWFVYNQDVAIFPLTMEKVSAEAAPATKAAVSMRGYAEPTRALRSRVFIPKEQRRVKAVKR